MDNEESSLREKRGKRMKVGILIIIMLIILVLGIPTYSLAQTKTHILMFSQGQEPIIAKMPQFAYAGTQPLGKDDKIIDAVHYTAKGSNVYEKVIQYHEQTYLKKGWNPAKMRMLVIVKNVNKAFSTSGNVSVSNSESESLNKSIAGVSKNTSSYMSNSGGIFPSFSKSWSDQKFEIWFFLTE